MKHFVVILLATLCAPALHAQAPGVNTEWDLRQLLSNLQTQAKHVRPIMDQIKPDAWIAKGASPTYVQQWTKSKAELGYFAGAIDAFSKQPERLTLAFETYFRMQEMERRLRSMLEGVRRYQNSALADLAQTIVDENTGNRDQLRQYIQDLALEKEQEFAVVDREAQRCRKSIANQPVTTPKTKH